MLVSESSVECCQGRVREREQNGGIAYIPPICECTYFIYVIYSLTSLLRLKVDYTVYNQQAEELFTSLST